MRMIVPALLLTALLAGATAYSQSVDVIVDQDGGVDDLAAIMLLVKSGRVRVRAIAVCPADSYLTPATRATQLVLDRIGTRGITIA